MIQPLEGVYIANFLQIERDSTESLIRIDMSTIAIVLDTRRSLSNGEYPLKIRYSHDDSTFYINLKQHLPKSHWDAKSQRVRSSHPLATQLNLKFSQQVVDLQKVVLDLELAGETPTVNAVKKRLESTSSTNCMFEYGNRLIAQLRDSRQYGNARTLEDSLRKLRHFIVKPPFGFDQLTYKFLREFESSMLAEGLKVNSISVYLRSLRAMFNKAIKEGIVDRSVYPFHDFKIKSERTVNRSLPMDVFQKLATFPLDPLSATWRFRQLFLISYTLMGISFVDMAFLQHENRHGDRLIYRRKKTGKIYSIKMTPHCTKLIDELWANVPPSKTKYILPILSSDVQNLNELMHHSREVYHRCNKYLKKLATVMQLEYKLSTYWSRYSWANHARDLGYSKDLIAEGLGHEYGNRVTGIYLDNYASSVIDEMNIHVVSTVLPHLNA